MINYELKFITFDDALDTNSSDHKSFKYESKKRAEESACDLGKRNYCERRGGHWRSPRPRHIRQLETKLRERTIVCCEWTSDTLITIVFSSGAITYLTVKPDTLDVTQILFDRYFVGKLSGQTVTNVALCKSHILFTHADRTATFVTFEKNVTSNQPCRITDRDPYLQSIELGGSSRRSERLVSSCENSTGVRVLIWSAATVEPAPWSPVIEDHANLHLYQINGQQITLIAYHQVENETLSAELSFKWDNLVHIVEQISCHKNGVTLDWLRYEVPNTITRATKLSSLGESATRVSLPAPARVVQRSPCDLRLLAACIDGSLHVVHHVAGLTHSTRAGFIATEVHWADELIVAAEEGGRLQCFDRALSLLHHHTKCLDLSSYLRDARRMKILATRSAKCGPIILASFTGGPLSLVHITHPRLITAWMRCGRSSNAVSLLQAMDWEREGTQCLRALNALVCATLRAPPDGVSQENMAQSALGAFLSARVPLPAAALRYAPPVHDLARKFFHHLLRRGRSEKALSLAVDLRAWDLCTDARWAAPRLAAEAAALAKLYHRDHRDHRCATRTDSECSGSCSHSYTDTDDETSVASDTVKTKPPPLPRVSLPNHPTLMPVPLAQAEPGSTTSIRPNLHQYLERDNTIWNTDLRDDTYIKSQTYDREHYLPISNSHHVKWHSVDVLSNCKGMSKYGLSTISEKPVNTITDILPRPHDDRLVSANFKHLFQKELREDAPHTLYRYQNNNFLSNTNLKDRTYRTDNDTIERSGIRNEKNKVKFSDTVTIAVVPSHTGSGGSKQEVGACPEPARELAESLPLCAPHNYLAAFALPPPAPQLAPQLAPHLAPHVAPPHAPHLAPHHAPRAPDDSTQKPLKIKVIHFGMV